MFIIERVYRAKFIKLRFNLGGVWGLVSFLLIKILQLQNKYNKPYELEIELIK